MCITQNNPSEPCCEDPLKRCKACPSIDWSSNTWLWSHDAYVSGEQGGQPRISPPHEAKMTTISTCEWQTENPLLDPEGVFEHMFGYFHLVRSRTYWNLDRQWWRLYFGEFVDAGVSYPGPYIFDLFLCTGEMVLTKSQERHDELQAQASVKSFETYPDTIRLRRVSGQGETLAFPFSVLT